MVAGGEKQKTVYLKSSPRFALFLQVTFTTKIVKYYYFFKLLIFYNCLKNIYHFLKFKFNIKFEFKKIKLPKKST